jgi:signal transduction histidine kinase
MAGSVRGSRCGVPVPGPRDSREGDVLATAPTRGTIGALRRGGPAGEGVRLRFSLAAKISFAFAGVTLLALVSSVLPLVLVARTRSTMESGVTQNVAHVRAVSELEIALLEQRGLISAFVHGGDRRWLKELSERKPDFTRWLGEVKQRATSAQEREIIADIHAVFAEYDEARGEVVVLYDSGRREEAREILLGRVNALYEKAHALCDQLVHFDYSHMDAALADWRDSLQHASILVAVCSSLTVVVSIALLAFLYRGVLRPLRRIATHARMQTGAARDEGAVPSTYDDVRAVGFYLETLSSDAAETRDSLEQSRTRLAHAEKLASVGKLAASVAHEIRNPLTSLKMQLYVIGLALKGNPRYEGNLKTVAEEVDRLDDVVRNFLEFARPPELKLQACDIGDVLEQTKALVRHKLKARNIDFAHAVPPGLPRVVADTNQLKQVFVNLISNAEEMMQNDGAIEAVASAETEPDGRALVVVRVRDTGPGIPAEARDRMFEPFFSTKPDGTGLGLCIAGRIMARHGGRLELESTSADGCVFAVSIPAEVN